MKIKVNLDNNERELIMNFLGRLSEVKIETIINNYIDYECVDNDIFNNLNVNEIFYGAEMLFEYFLHEEEILFMEVGEVLPFYYWLSLQGDGDTKFVLGKDEIDKDVLNTDDALINLYKDLDRALKNLV